MKISKLIWLISFLGLSMVGQDSLTIKFHQLVLNQQQQYNIPGLAVGVMQGDSIIFEASLGFSNLEKQIPLNDQHLFHTASLSKLFTAQAIMLLSDQGVLNLDDPVIQLWPEFRMKDQRYQQVTVRHLLRHTSGMPDVANYHWGSNTSLKAYCQEIVKKRLHFDPGSQFRYSNLGYSLLGYLVEYLTDKPFHTFMKQQVLLPAKMKASEFSYPRISESLQVQGYTRKGGKVVPRKVYPYNPAHEPSSTLNSNVRELLAWTATLYSETHDNHARFTAMIQTHSNFSKVGMGWFLGDIEGVASAYHFGGDRGFRGYLLLIPKHQLSLVVLANCDYSEDFRQEILHTMAKMIMEGYN